MKKWGYLVLAMALPMTAMAQSQKSFDDEVNSELDRMYQQQQAHQQAQAQVPAMAQPPVPQTVQVNVQQPVQQPVQQQTAVQKQPTTVIEATPLQESRVEKMRRARQESELQTEQKIVEKLELSRIEDERRRSEVLFGDKFSQMQNGVSAQPGQQQPQAAPALQQQQQQQPIPVVVVNQPAPAETVVKPAEKPEEKMDRDSVRQEITSALDEQKAKEEALKNGKKPYVSVLGGIGMYNNSAVQSEYAVGLGVGTRVGERMVVEGQFNYSDYKVQLPYSFYSPYSGTAFYGFQSDMKQYQGVGELKYNLMTGSIRPMVGAALAYTYRTYNAGSSGLSNFGANSNSVDYGLLIGADLDVADNFAIGVEARYMWNLENQIQTNNGYSNTTLAGSTTIESMGYSVIGVTGKMSF